MARDGRAVARADEAAPSPPGALMLGLAVLGGLGAWAARLVAGASLVGWACAAGWLGLATLYALSAAAVVPTLWVLWLSERIRRRAGQHPTDTGWQAAGFAARIGRLLNVLALALIVAETSLIPFIGPCAYR